MTYPEKIAYLYRYRDALRREKTIADEIEALRAEAARVTQALTGMPGGGDGQIIPRAVERILDAQQRLAAEAARCAAARAEVRAAIDTVPDPLRRDILTRRYILGQRWERIAADHNVTLRWAAKQHHRTVDAMEISPENPERVP